jgi:lysophospholipase L1-like esterase
MGSVMKLDGLSRPLAMLALGALAACSNGVGSGAPVPPATTPITVPSGSTPLVGIGDSLTAGYQSDGFLGATTATSPVSGYPSPPFPLAHYVPAGQENGWWSLMYQADTGASAASVYNPSTSPLPLIAAPGMGTQLVLNATSLFAPVQSSCSSVNDDGYSNKGWASTRMDPSDLNADLGVPGITMHEAVAMTGPITGPANNTTGGACGYLTVANDPTAGALQSLVSGESSVFYPVMGPYLAHVAVPTELNVALALKPKLTTVWLGANDLLKFSFAGGSPEASIASDSPAQMSADLTKIVKSLTAVGSKVLVADLPSILSAPQFFPEGNRLIADIATFLTPSLGSSTALAVASQINTYVGTQYGVTSGGYLTESGFLTIISTCEASASACLTPQLDPNGTGSGLGGYYLTPAVATKVATLNAAYNTAIDTVATTSGSNVALVPINATFQVLAPSETTPGAAPQLSTLIPGAPTASFTFGGGLVSWDGLHPSNLGYAVIADVFIKAADTGLGLSLPPITATQLNEIAATDPYNPVLPNTALGGPVFPLP